MLTGADLINTTAPPTGEYLHVREAAQALDYFHCRPYPTWSFGPQQWAPEKGPVPTALPYAKILVSEGADFVFQGGPPRFSVPDDPDADAFLAGVIQANRLTSRYNAIARQNGNVGTVAAKFSFDSGAEGAPVRVTFLSVPEECRVWTDPHDQQRLLMARIQYPYRDRETGKWYYYREEWTDEEWVTYLPREAGGAGVASPVSLPGFSDNLGDGTGFEIDQRSPNPFGLIPVTLIRNQAVEGSPLGVGDCWGAFRIIDRIAMTMHGEDHSNQAHSRPMQVFANAKTDMTGEVLSGEPIVINNTNPEGPPASFTLVEPSGAAREFSFKSIDQWEQLLYAQVGLSRLDPATLTNKGNMTRLALMTAYARTVATSDIKRTLIGEAGLCVFFRSLLVGLSRTGAFKELRGFGEMTEVNCEWADYFQATDQDLSDLTDRTATQVNNNLLPAARAATRLATAEGIPANEHPDLLKELAAEAESRRVQAELRAAAPGADTDAGEASEELSELGDSGGGNNFSA